MVTLEQAKTVEHFYHMWLKNADKTPVRCRANGKCKLWKRQPLRFKLPVKRGLKYCFYIDNSNAYEWTVNKDGNP